MSRRRGAYLSISDSFVKRESRKLDPSNGYILFCGTRIRVCGRVIIDRMRFLLIPSAEMHACANDVRHELLLWGIACSLSLSSIQIMSSDKLVITNLLRVRVCNNFQYNVAINISMCAHLS